MIITIEYYGIKYRVDLNDDIDRDQLKFVYLKLLLALGYSWDGNMEDTICDMYDQVLRSGMIKTNEKQEVDNEG